MLCLKHGTEGRSEGVREGQGKGTHVSQGASAAPLHHVALGVGCKGLFLVAVSELDPCSRSKCCPLKEVEDTVGRGVGDLGS